MTKIITEAEGLYGFWPRKASRGQASFFACDDVVRLSWKRGADLDVPNIRHTNEVIGAYVNAGARIHL